MKSQQDCQALKAYIYKINNIVNSKCYIGYTTNIEKRIKYHRLQSQSNGIKYLLQKAMVKYGLDKFTIEVVYDSEDLDHTLKVMEPLFINVYNSHYLSGNGYNMTYGGDACKGYVFTAADKLKMYSNRDLSKSIEVCSKTYKIIYSDFKEEIIKNLNKFCKDRDYRRNRMYDVMSGKSNNHKNIIKVELLS